VAGARVPPQTPFFLASITKLYIAAAILRLVERGLLHLDGRLSDCLPAGLIRGLHRFQGRDYTGQITLRHCLSHSTGLPDSLEERPRGGHSLLELAFEVGDRAWSLTEAIMIARDRLKPHFPPQDLSRPRVRIRYSDTNFQLLMAVIETVTAKTLAGAYDELLFQPLGLRGTRLPETPGEAPAPIYFGSRILELPRALESSRDLIAAPAEALAFLRALIQGSAFDRPETAQLMFGGPWRRFGLPRDAASLRAPSWPIEYGLGAMRFRLPRWLAPFQTPPELIGHTGSTGTWLFYCPSLELLFAGAVNEAGSGAVPYRFMPRLLRALRRSGFR
jgi:D-alanyl-D-alanine carboxypeptidase